MKKQPITFFSVRNINKLDEYTRFFHTRQYIHQKSAHFPDEKTTVSAMKKMMEFCGYSKFNKFKMQRKEWDMLIRNIPLSYFEYVGIDREILLFTLELDYQEYEQVLDIPLYPRFAVIRIMAAFYQERKFPENTPETAAIEVLKEFSKEKSKRCCINYPELKTIFVEPDGTVNVVHYPPAIKFKRKWAIPANNGHGIGMSYLG